MDKIKNNPSVETSINNQFPVGKLEKLPIDEVLHKHNLKVESFVIALKEGLTATRVIKDKYGDVVDEQPDHATRHKFFVSGMELLGYLKTAGVSVQVVNISQEERALLDAYKTTPRVVA